MKKDTTDLPREDIDTNTNKITILSPELIKNKLETGECVRKHDVRIEAEFLGILQDMIKQKIKGTIQLATKKENTELDLATGQLMQAGVPHPEYALFVATPEEERALRQNARFGATEERKAYLKAAIGKCLDQLTEFLEAKKTFKKNTALFGFDKGITAMIDEQIEKAGKIIGFEDTRYTARIMRESRNSGRGTCEWFPGYDHVTRRGRAVNMVVDLPDDIPFFAKQGGKNVPVFRELEVIIRGIMGEPCIIDQFEEQIGTKLTRVRDFGLRLHQDKKDGQVKLHIRTEYEL